MWLKESLMIEKPTVYLSNKEKHLTLLLRDNLFSKESKPFAKKFVFLPNASLKKNLLASFVSDDTLDVVLGIDFLELGKGVSTLYQQATGKSLLFPPQDLLTLHLEALLDKPHFAPALAKEFIKYGKYGGPFLKNWSGGWQKEIWDKVTKQWNYPYQLLESPLRKPTETAEIHLFNFPFLPKLYHLFFAKLAKYFPIYYYQFSPCREFWSDTLNEVEKVYLLEKDPQLSLYLEEGHPLLKNLGRMGRETFRIFEEEDFILEEHYGETPPQTKLSHLQSDMLHFRKGSVENDSTILLLPAPSKLREVEILYTKLLSLNCPPSEIQVFAPDISIYAPLIELVFGSDESPFDFTIRDLQQNPLLQTFLDLLTLNDHRFDPGSIFKLFSSPYFTSLSDKEVKEFKSWMEKSGVKWGVDSAHRKTLLPELLDTSESGTWEEAFDQLLNNLLFLPKQPTDWDLPYLDTADSVVLGKGISLIRSLRSDLDTLYSAEYTALEWCEKLLLLFNRYLDPSEEELAPIQEKILHLKQLDASYSFSSIKRYLQSSLKQKRGVRSAKQLEAITFRSLKAGTIFSSHTIVLLGMHEGAFPRPYISSSLNLLANKGDYIPSTPDEDRYLFLEAICAAQENLFITYQNSSEEDGKEQPPSLVVQELNPTVEKHPPFPFHHSYFKKKGVYSKKHFETAQTFYAPKEKRPFIPEFLTPAPLPSPTHHFAPTKEELSRFSKHPLRFYCNQILNLYLHYEDPTDPEFFLSPLQKYRLLSAKDSLKEAEERGHLPLGRFKEIAQKKIIEDYKPETEEGFVVLGKDLLSELIKIYPLYLLESLKAETPLISLKSGDRFTLKTDPQKAFNAYLEYYDIAQQTPSPLHPLLADALLRKDAKTLATRIKNGQTEPYMKTLFTDCDPAVVFETWAPLLRKTFRPLLEMLDETV